MKMSSHDFTLTIYDVRDVDIDNDIAHVLRLIYFISEYVNLC